jgi:hypothetical protein
MTNKLSFKYIHGEKLVALESECQDVINFALSLYGVTLKFDDQSIQWLSSVIEATRNNQDEKTIHVMSIKFSIFLGNAIISCHGGRWIVMNDGVIGIKLSNGSMLLPFLKVCRQFENGLVDNIYGMYQNVEALLQEDNQKNNEQSS